MLAILSVTRIIDLLFVVLATQVEVLVKAKKGVHAKNIDENLVPMCRAPIKINL